VPKCDVPAGRPPKIPIPAEEPRKCAAELYGGPLSMAEVQAALVHIAETGK